MTYTIRLLTLVALPIFSIGCGSSATAPPVLVGGSSTLAPLTEAVVADFAKSHRTMPVTVSSAGTVEGFVHFCRGELDIVDASRPIVPAEQTACEGGHVVFVELPVAHDALTVIVNAGNTWASDITVAELRKLWEPEAEQRVTKWNQVRASWPDRPIKLFAPGAESGTFDYFTQAVMGTVDASRKDYTSSGDDTVITGGVAADVEALGYVGYSYFDRNRKTLKALAIDDGDDSVGRGAIEPSPESVGRGLYRPFGRPLFIYVNLDRLGRPEVKAFAESYLRHAGDLAKGAGAVPLTATAYSLAEQRLARGATGTMYTNSEQAKLGIDILLGR